VNISQPELRSEKFDYNNNNNNIATKKLQSFVKEIIKKYFNPFAIKGPVIGYIVSNKLP